MKLLLIDTHDERRLALTTALRETGYSTDATGSTEQALLHICRRDYYDGILVDSAQFERPADEEPDLLHILRYKLKLETPVIALLEANTSKGDTACLLGASDADADPSALASLHAWNDSAHIADAKIYRPVLCEELDKRLLASRYTRARPLDTLIDLSHATVDLNRRRIYREGREFRIARRECCLLKFLLCNRGQVVHCERMLQLLNDERHTAATVPLLRGLVSRLRRKLGKSSIYTLQETGYMIPSSKTSIPV